MKWSQEKIVNLEKNGNVLSIRYPPHSETIERVKKISHRKWDSRTKTLYAPLCIETVQNLENWDFSLCKELILFLKKQENKLIPKRKLKIPGLNGTLKNYQKEGICFINDKNGQALIGDDMGLGKTVQALAYLQQHPELRPALIICPAPLKIMWEKECHKWLSDKKETYLISGKYSKNTDVFPKKDIYIINYDITFDTISCPYCKGKKKILIDANGEGCYRKCRKCKATGKITTLREDLKNMNPEIVIWDEIHKLAKEKSQRTLANYELSKRVHQKIGLSGTPIENSHVDLYWPIKIINPTIFSSFWKYAQRYCDAKKNHFGWDFSGSSNGKELNDIVTTNVLIRRLKSDVLDELPPKNKIVIPLQVKNLKDYKKAEINFKQWIYTNLDNKTIKNITPKTMKKKGQMALAQINVLKQLAVKGKINEAIAWIKDFLESGEKLIVFAHHHDIMDRLESSLKKVCVKLDGRMNSRQKEESKEIFQNDPECKIIIGSESMREGYTLTAASYVCFVEFLGYKPTWHKQAEDRAHRIGQYKPVTIYYLLADKTIELDIAKILDKKHKIISNTLDDTDLDENEMIYNLLLNYKEKEYV